MPSWKPRRWRRGLLALAPLLLAACSRDSITSPGRDISGPLVLVGYLTDSTGRFVGTRVVPDADGVPVELVSNAGVVATTTTVRGRYTFPDPAPGSYFARARITPEILAQTHTLTVNDSPVLVADTLRLQSRGDLYPVPNPFTDSLTTSFMVGVDEQASLRVLDRTGRLVRVVLDGQFRSGLNLMGWDGTDSQRVPVEPGLYWLTFSEPAGTRAQLLFRR